MRMSVPDTDCRNVLPRKSRSVSFFWSWKSLNLGMLSTRSTTNVRNTLNSIPTRLFST